RRDAVDIGRDGDNAVRIVAGEIGIDAACSHRAGLLVRRAGSLQERRADAGETIDLHDRHVGFPWGSSTNLPASRRVLLVVTAAWSQSRLPMAMTPRRIHGCNAIARGGAALTPP